jgi:hypothetical protein
MERDRGEYVCHSDPEQPEYGFLMRTKYCGVKEITKESPRFKSTISSTFIDVT